MAEFDPELAVHAHGRALGSCPVFCFGGQGCWSRLGLVTAGPDRTSRGPLAITSRVGLG